MKLFCLVAVLGFVGCADPVVPDGSPSMVGEIVLVGDPWILPQLQGTLQVHVRTPLDVECGITFVVDEVSLVADARGGTIRRAGVEVLELGSTVAVWHDDVDLSCPTNGYAIGIERRR